MSIPGFSGSSRLTMAVQTVSAESIPLATGSTLGVVGGSDSTNPPIRSTSLAILTTVNLSAMAETMSASICSLAYWGLREYVSGPLHDVGWLRVTTGVSMSI